MQIITNGIHFYEKLHCKSDFSSSYIDVGGLCSCPEFPGEKTPIFSLFSNTVNLCSFKNDDWTWRLKKKTRNAGKITLKFHNTSNRYCVAFAANSLVFEKNYWYDMQLQQVIRELGSKQYYKGIITEDAHRISLSNFSELDMICELEKRAKQKNPDWAKTLLETQGNKEKNISNVLYLPNIA